jgi:hypothetical protein
MILALRFAIYYNKREIRRKRNNTTSATAKGMVNE